MIEAEVYTLSTDMWRRVGVSLESLRRFGTEDFIFSRVGSQNPFVKIIDTGIYHLILILRDLERLCCLRIT